MNNFWNPSIEKISRDELHSIQTKKLKATVERIYTYVPYYRAKMQDKGLLPGDIATLEDLDKLPFTTKQDLRETYPYGLFAAPLEQIVRLHASSGTTGKQIVVGYTKADLDIWSECVARCLYMAGADSSYKVQVSYGYGLFTGGLGLHSGAERIGATVVPTSSGNTQRQVAIIRDFGSNILACTPSYALYIAETMQEIGIKKEDIQLKAGIFGAEPWTPGMRKEIEERLGIVAHDIYGLSEIMGPGVSQDCWCQNGLHVWEDHFIPEIIDTNTGEVLPGNTEGELVFTTITKEGFPLLRYRTRDIASLNYEKCECGRTHVRMSKPNGRTDDMLIIRGVNVFPSQIESVLLEVSDTTPHYQILVERKNNTDIITVEIEVSESIFFDDVKGIENLERTIKSRVESVLGISCRIRLVEPKYIQRSEGKAKRVIDKRNL